MPHSTAIRYLEAARVDAAPERPRLTSRHVFREALGADATAQMLGLLGEHFSGVDPVTFQSDLAEKSHVILLEDRAGRLRGFSTFLMYSTRALGRPLTVVYSGDTIVEPSAWGSPELPRAWIRAVYAARGGHPAGELYWLLLTSGFRTYRFLSVFWRRFHPRFDEPTPAAEQRLLDELSRQRFGSRYDPGVGVVRLARPQVLRQRLIGVPSGRCTDPHVRYFLEKNPGHQAGDELVALASLERSNLTPAGRRMLR